MGILKRIATARIWNPLLEGGNEDPEIAAMRRLLAVQDRQANPETTSATSQEQAALKRSEGQLFFDSMDR